MATKRQREIYERAGITVEDPVLEPEQKNQIWKEEQRKLNPPVDVRTGEVLEQHGVATRHHRMKVVRRPDTEYRVEMDPMYDPDINNIVAKYRQRRQPLPPPPSNVNELYGDFSNGFDLYAAREAIEAAEDSFMRLSPELRRFASDDPVVLAEMVRDPEFADQLRELGLAELVDSIHGPVESQPAQQTDVAGVQRPATQTLGPSDATETTAPSDATED